VSSCLLKSRTQQDCRCTQLHPPQTARWPRWHIERERRKCQATVACARPCVPPVAQWEQTSTNAPRVSLIRQGMQSSQSPLKRACHSVTFQRDALDHSNLLRVPRVAHEPHACEAYPVTYHARYTHAHARRHHMLVASSSRCATARISSCSLTHTHNTHTHQHVRPKERSVLCNA
jgi:hypothetical protein